MLNLEFASERVIKFNLNRAANLLRIEMVFWHVRERLIML